jgi:colanic acid biosynthesis glycosyl transferase WcaI
MRIHIVTNLFSPDELAGASLFTDLALYLRDAGHEVQVTTTFSYYPAWRLQPADQGVDCRDETFNGIPLRRVSMYVPEKPTGRGRMLSDFSFLVSLLRRGRFPNWTPDVVLTALPMISQCLAQRFMYPFRGIPRFIVVQDFVAEAALELGILRMPGAATLLRGIQRWALRSAQTIATISPEMLKKLELSIGSGRRTLFIPNWIHKSLQEEICRQQKLKTTRKQQSLFYAGNLGVKQGLPDFLAQFADAGGAAMQWQMDIFGGGAEKKRIEDAAANTAGINMGPVLEEEQYISSLLSATACLVTQRPGTGANFLPSKLLPALATATPVLAVCDKSSPLAYEVLEGKFGEVIEPGSATSLMDCLSRWKAHPELLAAMSQHAVERAVLYHRDTILPRYEQELLRLKKPSA